MPRWVTEEELLELQNPNAHWVHEDNLPIITHDPNDPRLRAYQDSLNAYNSSIDFYHIRQGQLGNDLDIQPFDSTRQIIGYSRNATPWTTINTPELPRAIYDRTISNPGTSMLAAALYTKPTQPYKLDKRVKQTPIEFNPSNQDQILPDLNKIPLSSDKLPLPKPDWFSRVRQDQETGDLEYFDKATGKKIL